MRERRKDALKLLAIATPMLVYGALTFEIGGAASSAEAIAKSTVTTLGIAGTVAGLLMFFTKNSLGIIETKPKVVQEEKPNDSWRKDTVWKKEEPIEEEEPKLKMPS